MKKCCQFISKVLSILDLASPVQFEVGEEDKFLKTKTKLKDIMLKRGKIIFFMLVR